MTNDIVERLREDANTFWCSTSGEPTTQPLLREAADEIERLRDQNSKLLSTNYDIGKGRDRFQSWLFSAESLLQAAKVELDWWADQHPCCRGHQEDLLVRIAEHWAGKPAGFPGAGQYSIAADKS